ncbi:sensor domain-containing protein (plasmid) [Mycolicibacterium fluoranthenivorans]|uniref:Sensor domain-containing protein n=1 Tax=Mycolicibacterium fluoranthenivorans TaxID=258505 RepID=A0A7G8PQE7_9MYCO|nr:sensor domain-containing protein [Mycolicibacterium fluoranthenivorans]QNJ96563.1 sensor domain-containing protein [Mycolicibacterium fluoranthenivorans]
MTVRLVMGLLGAGLLVVGCSDSSGDSAPAPVTDTAPAVTSTSPPAPRLVSAAAAGDALLKRTELGQIIGDTDLRQNMSYTKPWESGQGVQPGDCAPRLLFSEAVAAAGYQAAVGDSNRCARGQSAAQMITVFVDRDQPARVVGDLGRMLGYCAEGESFSTTAGDVTQQWTAGPAASDALGPVSGETRAGGGAQRQQAPPRNCYHAVRVRANVVVESVVCGDGDSTGQAREVVDRITAKLPP